MTDLTPTQDELVRYAGGLLGWSTLRDRGVTYDEVLTGLGRLGLRPPIAPLDGPNRDGRLRGLAMLRDRLKAEP